MIKFKWHWIDYIFLVIILALLVRSFLFQSYKVDSGSMVPTLVKNDLILCYNPFFLKKYDKKKIHRNDIVVFRAPVYPHEEYVKRVVGLGGDKIAIISNCAYVNEKKFDDKILKSNAGFYFSVPELTIQSNFVFVLGDNRGYSSDSRSWGALSLTNINGKCLLIYWPLSHFHFF